MFLWFAILVPILVAGVFRSPMIDYRIVAVGAVLPAIEVALGHPFVLHTLVGASILLGVVVAGTQNKRLVRRRLLGLPIGVLFHLVLDGSWTRASLFWWPAFGLGFGDRPVPEVDHSIGVLVGFEILAVVAGAWAWRRFGLADSQNRDLLTRTGQLDRSVLSP